MERLRAALTRSEQAHAADSEVAAEVRGDLRAALARAEQERDQYRAFAERIERFAASSARDFADWDRIVEDARAALAGRAEEAT